MTIDRICQTCSRPFKAKRCDVIVGRGRFCSRECAVQGRTRTLTVQSLTDCVTETQNGCWEWNGYRQRQGYGVSTFSRCKGTRAHRVVWELFNGPIPDGLFVCHRCDNPPCVNPSHLFLGTNQDNQNDCDSKGRRPRGDTQPNSKLTSEDVKLIKHLRTKEGWTYSALGKKFGVCTGTVRAIIRHDPEREARIVGHIERVAQEQGGGSFLF